MPTDAPFDPCRQWLGIDAVHVGNARLVLGVSPQEADPLVVLRAAEARLNLLRAISPGPFEMARAGLIKRVEEAREKLLAEIAASPPRPPRADAAVAFAMPAPPSQRTASEPPVSATRPGVVPGLPPAVPGAVHPVPPTVPGGDVRADGGGVETIAIRTTVYRKKTPVAGIATALLALSAMSGGLFYYTSYGKAKAKKSGERQAARAEPAAAQISPEPTKDRTSESAERPARKPAHMPAQMEEEKPADPTDDRAVSTSKPPSQRKERTRRSRPEPEPGPEPEEARAAEEAAMPAVTPPQPMRPAAPPKPADADSMAGEEKPAGEKQAEAMAEDDGQLDAALAEVLEALQRQEYDSATSLLAAASKQTGGRKSGEASQRIDHWRQLATYSKGFMDYREQALAAVKPGDEYEVNSKKINVVEIDDTVFKYRVTGETKRTDRDKIPGGIVLAIVTEWFDANPANDLYVGAYHLAKPEPDLTRAREHWERAEAAGADASGLMSLLDDPVFAKSE
jgi:hypothetical protein